MGYFFEEHNNPFIRDGKRFEADGLTIICDNFFAQMVQNVGKIDLVYERASLVAFPESLRMQYTAKINEFLLMVENNL